MAENNLQIILQQLQAEKSIDREHLLEAIRSAIESAARKGFNPRTELTVDLDPNTLQFKLFEIRNVVEEIEDEVTQLTVEEAQALNPNANAGDRLKVPVEPRDFGRVAAQTAKQVILQKIKDAERERVFGEFKNRQGEMVTGEVKRLSHGNIIVSIGKAEAVLPHREQSPREMYKPGDRIRAYILEVDSGARGPQIILSRATPELVRALFEVEVPEVYDGTIEIRAVARDAGNRTKIAVHSNDANVDPVGACVGMRGSRVRTVVEELSGEKIDIVRWSDDPVEMCGNALNPADILDITLDEENRVILVLVPEDQLSLAIGKRGQNARLASRLMGWSIDIKSEEQLRSSLGGATEAERAAQAFREMSFEETPEEDAEGAAEAEAEAEAEDPNTGEEVVDEDKKEEEPADS